MSIASEIELPIPLASVERPDISIILDGEVHDSDQRPPGVVVASSGEGDAWWYVATEYGTGYLLRFARCGEFEISDDLATVRVRRDPQGEHAHLLPVLAAGTVLAFLLTLRGSTVLHASAVSVDGRAVAFVGQSGRGKSTVAALMCVAGAALVSDDVLVVDADDVPTCIGGTTELRLRPKAAPIVEDRPHIQVRSTPDDRLAMMPEAVAPGRLPLAAIVVPNPSREVTEVGLVRAAPPAALYALLTYPRIFGWRRRVELDRDFVTLSRLVESVPLYGATIPWGPPFDPSVTESLFALAAEAAFEAPADR